MGLKRHLLLDNLLKRKSYFLFGPRGTGKTTWIRETLDPIQYPFINLLQSESYLRLLRNPEDIRQIVTSHPKAKAFVIDEIQKIPELLDEIHDLIESKQVRFLLTGSSSRKLKRTGANLLAGRARMAHLFPFTSAELGEFDRDKLLHLGALPAVYFSQEPWADLRAYVDMYLKEEIEQEAQVRNLGQFSRFLYGAALHNADLLNYANVASDSQVPESTVRGYYQILSDTLIGTLLEPFRESKKRKAIQTGKFYFFDTGVVHAILNMKQLHRASPEYGKALEQWIFMELTAYISYLEIDEPLRFWRSVNGQEVDFLVGNQLAIEVKSKKRVSSADLSGLRALQEEGIIKQFFCLSNDPICRKEGGIALMPFDEFLKELWQRKLL